MDNFRNNRQNRRTSGSLDGFIAGAPRSRPAAANISSQKRPASTLGNFRSVDGFHPSSPSTLTTTAKQPAARQPNRDETGRIKLDMPPAASKSSRKLRKWPKLALKTSGIMALILIVLGGALFGRGLLKARQIFKGGGGAAALNSNVNPSQLRGEGDGRINLLMLGKGGPGHSGADLTDTIIVASIDPVQKEAALLSIPRDFYVKSGSMGYSKINSVYANAKNQELNKMSSKDPKRTQKGEEAGLKAVEGVVEASIGIPIHYRVMVDFNGFKKAIDTVGGVEANITKELAVSEQMTIDNKRYFLNVQPGKQRFDGFRALAFARSRYTSARGDFDRAGRQRLILVALKDKIFSSGTYGNPIKINQLISNFGNNIQANMTTDEVVRLYKIGSEIESNKILSLSLADPPNVMIKSSSNERGESIQIPKAGLGNYKEIHSFVRNSLKDSFLKNENATVAVLNGTNVAGLATRTADDLKSYGYNISQIADAPTKGLGQTVVVDMRNNQKPFTEHYLETRFSVKSVNSLPDKSIIPGNADFVIILGQNEVSRLGN